MLLTATTQVGGFFFFPGQADDANLFLGIGGGIARMSKSTHKLDIVFQNGTAGGFCFGDPNISGSYFYYSCGGTLTRGPLATGKPTTDVVATTNDQVGLDEVVITNHAAYWMTFLQSASHEAVERAELPP